MMSNNLDREENSENFKIPINKIPIPEHDDLFLPWWFQSFKGDTRIKVYDNREDISQALMKSIKKEYPFFGFTTWENAQTSDTEFKDKMAKYLKKPKYFDTGKEAYEYIIKKHPDNAEHYRHLLS